jgi:hypothetical protein
MTDAEKIKELEERIERYEKVLTYVSHMTPFTGSVDAKAVFDAAAMAKEALKNK